MSTNTSRHLDHDPQLEIQAYDAPVISQQLAPYHAQVPVEYCEGCGKPMPASQNQPTRRVTIARRETHITYEEPATGEGGFWQSFGRIFG